MANGLKSVVENTGGVIFWLSILLLSLGGALYLAIWAFFAENSPVSIISQIFLIMMLIGIVSVILAVMFKGIDFISSGTFSENALSFTLGFIIWSSIVSFAGGSQNSILSVGQNNLFASIASQLPQSIEFLFNTFIIPVAEESFWIIAIPFVVILIMDYIGNSFSIAKNPVIQIITVAVIGGLTFAVFHVGKLFLAFIIAAIIFRSLIVVGVYGDLKLDIIPGIKLLPAFAVGAHIGNNWADYGLLNGIGMLNANFFTYGWIIYSALLIILIFSINQIGLWRLGKQSG